MLFLLRFARPIATMLLFVVFLQMLGIDLAGMAWSAFGFDGLW